jgi:predicted ATPase with chaperone activity
MLGSTGAQRLDTFPCAGVSTRSSACSFDRIIRVARIIADLAGEERLARNHLAEALMYRRT